VDEATSARAARLLQSLGFDAAALKGGYNAWRAAYPVEPKAEVA
jgi:rhodanese-related sulfurtransferase